VRTPFKGETRRLCDMARENAAARSLEYAKSSEKSEKSLVRLASLCGLETVPERIEAFDISNFGDEAITAGMYLVWSADGYKKTASSGTTVSDTIALTAQSSDDTVVIGIK
jgi:excinuclease UvrABC nuclease subunit